SPWLLDTRPTRAQLRRNMYRWWSQSAPTQKPDLVIPIELCITNVGDLVHSTRHAQHKTWLGGAAYEQPVAYTSKVRNHSVLNLRRVVIVEGRCGQSRLERLYLMSYARNL